MNSHILFSCYIDSQVMHRHTDYIRSCTSDHIETTDATDDEDFLLELPILYILCERHEGSISEKAHRVPQLNRFM